MSALIDSTKNMSLLLRISLSVLICGISVSQGFLYENPEEWGNENPMCRGKSQSPINIDYSQNEVVKDMVPMKWNGYDNPPDIMRGINNGNTIKVIPQWTDESKRPYLSGGPLSSEYVFQEFHFHWGADNSAGSEHTVNGKSFALEAHMVHWKVDYGSLEAAVGEPDGLAVVGSFYDVINIDGKYSNIAKDIMSIASTLFDEGREAEIEPFPISNFDVVNTTDVIASYQGSLTTPGCNEAVTWVVAIHEYPISEDHMKAVRSVQLKRGGDHNNRPIQPLNDRQVIFFH